jgi:hypothetical protein
VPGVGNQSLWVESITEPYLRGHCFENCERSSVLLLVQTCPLDGAALNSTRVTKIGFVFKMNRYGDLSYYLTVRGNVTVCVGFRCKHLSLLFLLQYNDFRNNVQTCPLSPTSCCVTAFCGKGGLRIDFFLTCRCILCVWIRCGC